MEEHDSGSLSVIETEDSRRAFLAKCGKFAVVTSPAVTLLLDTSMASASMRVSGKPDKHGKHHKRQRHGRRRRRLKHHKVIHYDGGKGPKW